jgi:hypothetical protein
LTAASGWAAEPRPALLLWGASNSRVQPEFARFLADQGFEVQWGEPTAERLKTANVLVLMGARAGRSFPAVLDFAKRGGGLWVEPEIGQAAAVEVREQYELMDAIQVALYAELLADTSRSFGPLGVNYAHTARIAKTAVSEGVSSVWYPVGDPGGNVGTIPLGLGAGWETVVTAETTAKVQPVRTGGVVPPERQRKGVTEPVPFFAIRQGEGGRMAVCGIHSSFLFASGFSPALGRVTTDTGIGDSPSHMGKLLVNTLRWLAEPTMGKAGFGGAKTDPKLLREASIVEDLPPRDWRAARFPPAKPNWHGVVGARTTRSTGKSSAADFVAAAKKAGLHFIVFLEDFTMLTREEFESLRAECARMSDGTFQAYPGFTIEDVYGNHYFVCGPKALWPEKDLLDADGKRFTDVFHGINPKEPGTLGAVLLEYWLKRGEFILGTYLHKRNKLPYYDFRAYDSMAVVTQQDGQTIESLEEMFQAHQHLTNRGECLRVFALTFMDSPDDLRYVADGTYYHMAIETDELGKLEHAFRAFNSRMTMSPYNYTTQVTRGPLVDEWRHLGDGLWRDYPGYEWYRWDLYRWRLRLRASSPKGLKEVRIYDGDELFRRFLAAGAKTFEWESDLAHNQQHNLFVLATDVDGRQTLTTELWDRIHLFEEYMCYDRMNQLPWGQARWENTRTQARIISPTPATAVKGPWGSYMASSPAGLYSTDARLGAGTVFGFDGTGGAAVPSIEFAPRIEGDWGIEAANWGRVNSNRILHSADIQCGIGTLDGIYVNEKRRGQNKTVWETMMPTEPAKLLEASFKHTAFHPHTAGLGAAEIVDLTVGLKQNMAVKKLTLTAGCPAPQAAREGETIRSRPEELKETWLRRPGDYILWSTRSAAQAVFNLSEHTLVFRGNTIELPVSQVRAGQKFAIRLLVIGVPYTIGKDPAWVEDLRVRMGLADGQSVGYRLEAKAGVVSSRSYVLAVDGQGRGFRAVLTPDRRYPVSMPIQVANLNPRWPVFFADLTAGQRRPIGRDSEGAAYVAYDLGTVARDIFIGHPFVCAHPEITLTVAQTGPSSYQVEAHNPTDQPMDTTISANPTSGISAEAQRIHLPAGSSKVIVVNQR